MLPSEILSAKFFNVLQDLFPAIGGQWYIEILVPTIFHNDHISQGLCKIVWTTFQCIVVLQSHGEGQKSQEKRDIFGTNFQDLLPAIGEQWYIEIKFWNIFINPEIYGHYGKIL